MSYKETSSLQKYIWLDQKLNLNSPKYNIGGYAELKGEIDVEIFKKSIEILLTDNSIFSYKFYEKDGVPLFLSQKPDLNKCFKFFKDENKEGVLFDIKNDFLKPFNINQSRGLLNIWLVRTDKNNYLWYIKLHHLISDGFSFHLIFNEVSRIYHSILSGKLDDVKEFKLDYSFDQYINEERQYRTTSFFNESEKFWLDKYKNPEPLIYSKKNDTQTKYSKEFVLSEFLSQELKKNSKIINTSEFHVLIGLLYLVISKYYRRTTFSVGMPVLNRKNKLQKKVIGPFINVIPLRLSCKNDNTFQEFLHQIKKEIFTSYRHQRFQIADIIKNSSYSNENRLYDIRLSYEKSYYDSHFSNIQAIIKPLSNESEDDPISIHIFDNNDGVLRFRFDVNEQFVPKFQIEQIFQSYQFVIEQLAKIVNKKISEISICSPQQKKSVLAISKGKKNNRPKEGFISLWEKNLHLFEDKVAITSNGLSFTYFELDIKANRLANHLVESEIKRGSIVLVDLPNSEKNIIAILALFKLTAIYVPVDNTLPQKRKDYILKDSKGEIVITDKGNLNSYQRYVDIDDVIDNSQISNKLNISDLNVNDGAYIIYTSGSTGNPKGVLISQKSLYDYILTFSEFFSINSEDRILQQSSMAFDTSIEEIFPILSVGGTLVFATDSRDFHHIFVDCEMHNVTILSTNPFVIDYLNQFNDQYVLKLKTIISGGDVLKYENIDNIFKKYSIYNTYGPTEATVCVSYHKIEHKERPIPIGKPISNNNIYILDNKNLLPKGAIGEIGLSGSGLAKKYLNKNKLTKHNFFNLDGERVYLTGDLGQWNFQNSLLFNGRCDNQINYRGFRIEPEEIEVQLKKAESKILECLIVVKEIEKRPTLVAYVKVSNSEMIKIEGLKSKLKNRLPLYMIPDCYVTLVEFPMTQNGKIDRKKLPLPKVNTSNTSNRPVENPSTFWENKLIKIWNKLLKISELDVNSDFFELGGHSLLANQFISNLRESNNIEISLRDFYSDPTIKGIARLIESNDCEVFEFSKAPKNALIPLSYPQEQLWFLNQLYKDDSAYLVPRAIKLKGNIDYDLIKKVFNKLIKKHEILRTVFYIVDGVPYQKILNPFDLNIPIKSLIGLLPNEQDEFIEKFILEEGNRSFDIEKGPLLRVTILKISENENILILCEHHLIHDGWTQGILLKEFIEIYSSLIYNPSFVESTPIFQYKDYAYWQKKYLNGAALEKRLSYWENKLKNVRSISNLPLDYKRNGKVSKKGGLFVKVLNEGFSDDLRSFSIHYGVTLFITMLTGFKILLSKCSNENDIVVGTGTANRKLSELEGMLGMIINTLALRTKFRNEDTILEILNKVKNTCFESYGYEDTPFSKVVERVNPKRELGVSPIIQHFFGFMNTPSRGLELPDLNLEVLNSYNRSSKFDINIVVVTPLEQSQMEGIDGNDRRIILEWEYNADLFNSKTMERMLDMYLKILEEMLSNPNQYYYSFDYLSSLERKQLLSDFNDTDVSYP
ncbi:amino acid adenylation domain-containing protein, partial [Aquimarina algiphila]